MQLFPATGASFEHMKGPLLRRKHSRTASGDGNFTLASLEARLTEKTSLIDEMKKVVPLDTQAPGIIVVGGRGAGKSTVLEAITGVPLPRGVGATRRPIQVRIVSDPTAPREYALVSGTDSTFREDTKRVESLSELPRIISQLTGASSLCYNGRLSFNHADESGTIPLEELKTEAQGDEAAEDVDKSVWVRVVRPTGPTYTFVDLPGFNLTHEGNVPFRQFCRLMEENSDRVILAILPVTDVFHKATPIQIAKKVDPESKRTIGVVTQIHLIEKDMGIVEKLQMTSQRNAVLPLGYVAVRAAMPEDPNASWPRVLAAEKEFFLESPLLKGLRPERWSLSSLKTLVVNFQANAITQRIPQMTHKVRTEIELLEGNGKNNRSLFAVNNPLDYFTNLCAEITSVAFDINELACGSSTRQDRRLNLGPRFLMTTESRELEARHCLPSCLSDDFGAWLAKELEEFRGVVANNDSMMHPIFRKAVREICFPVLRKYAAAVINDADTTLREVTALLLDERFGSFPRLVESLRRDVGYIQTQKRLEAELLIGRILEAELNWIFVSESDLMRIQKDVDIGVNGAPPVKPDADLWSLDDVPGASSSSAASVNTAATPEKTGPEGNCGTIEPPTEPCEGEDTDPSSPPDQSVPLAALAVSNNDVSTSNSRPSKAKLVTEDKDDRGLKAMQLALDAYVRLLLRRLFYAVPMNTRNIIMNEFRRDLVSLIAEGYNDDSKLRTLMSEELWVGHGRQQRHERRQALLEILRKLDELS